MEAKIGQDGWTDQRQTAQSHVNDRIQTNSIEFATIPPHFFIVRLHLHHYFLLHPSHQSEQLDQFHPQRGLYEQSH